MLKPISPELVLFPDFCVSNIPRYLFLHRNAVGRPRLSIHTIAKEQKVRDVDIEIIFFVVNGSVKLTMPPNQAINSGYKSFPKEQAPDLLSSWSFKNII